VDLGAGEAGSAEPGAHLRCLPVAKHVLPFIDFSLPSSKRSGQAELHVVETAAPPGEPQQPRTSLAGPQ
jgi:hypothetical protein